jgi:hypothetical protein
MNRNAILKDGLFWQRLEYAVSRVFGSSEQKTLRRFWVDGFVPEGIDNTKAGVDVSAAFGLLKAAKSRHWVVSSLRYRSACCKDAVPIS